MALKRFYSQESNVVSISIDNLPAFVVEGINGDEGSIELVTAPVLSATTVGLDSVTLSYAYNPTAELSIKLNPDSNSIENFSTIYNAHMAGSHHDMSIFLLAGNGESTVLTGCALEDFGSLSTGGAIGPMRIVKFNCSQVKHLVS